MKNMQIIFYQCLTTVEEVLIKTNYSLNIENFVYSNILYYNAINSTLYLYLKYFFWSNNIENILSIESSAYK